MYRSRTAFRHTCLCQPTREGHTGLRRVKYLIVVEKGETSYSAYSPDVPGCFATGATVEEAEAQMVHAIQNYLDELAAQSAPLPEPATTSASFVLMTPHSTGHAA